VAGYRGDDQFVGVYTDPAPLDYALSAVSMFFGIAATLCVFLIPWILQHPGVEPSVGENAPFYVMVIGGPSCGVVAIAVWYAAWRHARNVRPETTPKKMQAAGLILGLVPLFVGVATLFAFGMASG
jgi:hypothetical protein